MTESLKACPFCGWEPQLLTSNWEHELYAATCQNDRCPAYHRKDDYSIGRISWRYKELAIAAWNRRAS